MSEALFLLANIFFIQALPTRLIVLLIISDCVVLGVKLIMDYIP